MDSNKQLCAAKAGYVVVSLLLCGLGAALLLSPAFPVSLLYQTGGGLLILFGCVRILGYFSKDLYRLAFQFDLALGIFLLALGVLLLRHASQGLRLICIPLSIYILVDALLKIQIALDARPFGIRYWWAILAAALPTGLDGFVLLFLPYESARAAQLQLGSCLVLEGVLNLVTILLVVRVSRRRLTAHAPQGNKHG